MSEQEIMDAVKNELNKLSDEEKVKRAKSLKKLLDDEINRRKMQAFKKPKK